jgi:hypothetical protein
MNCLQKDYHEAKFGIVVLKHFRGELNRKSSEVERRNYKATLIRSDGICHTPQVLIPYFILKTMNIKYHYFC